MWEGFNTVWRNKTSNTFSFLYAKGFCKENIYSKDQFYELLNKIPAHN